MDQLLRCKTMPVSKFMSCIIILLYILVVSLFSLCLPSKEALALPKQEALLGATLVHGENAHPEIRHHLDEAYFRSLRESSVCNETVYKLWNAALKTGYDPFKGQCLTPELVSSMGRKHGVSGPGSSVFVTQPLRDMLHRLFTNDTLNIKTFLDVPCGDWVWMQLTNLAGIEYIGGDVTENTISENRRCFAREHVSFFHFDLSCMVPPAVDLMLTRDLLFHLENEAVLNILHSVNGSGVRYFASTTWLGDEQPPWVAGTAYAGLIGFRKIRLQNAPFCLQDPIFKVEDNSNPGRYVAVWKLPFSGC